ncbi:ketopantoate reductase family protein [Halobacillus sp. Marseille-Q1614]|uniref:ketopantoate reductase family protein n=1 Tax=Halobacillus sp. Marseille-Q1614 TaxID=2709134 RepID=UPI00156D7D2E|nr:2-dehydropantoate 2-reductase [Halobacillus sp. Marseille-Q1614]
MKVGILGGGSIGLLIASYLNKEHDVTLYVRTSEQKEQINIEGITCDTRHSYITACLSEEIHKTACDVMIITVKQYHLKEAIVHIPVNIPLLFLQNGMTHLSLLESIENPCAVGVVEHGALKTDLNKVSHTGKGSIHMAAFKGAVNLNEWQQRLTLKEFPFFVQKNYHSMLAEKLIINTVINPLTAIFRVKNAQVIENSHIKHLARRLCAEASLALDLKESEQWVRVKRIAENTGKNRSSMYKDIENGSKTEVEAICGYILHLLKEQAPFHKFVLESIRALEEKNRKGERL